MGRKGQLNRFLGSAVLRSALGVPVAEMTLSCDI